VVGVDRINAEAVKSRSKEWRTVLDVADRVGTIGEEHYEFKRDALQNQTGSFGSVTIAELVGTGVEFAIKQIDLRGTTNAAAQTKDDQKEDALVEKRAFYEEEVLNGIGGHPFCIELYDSFFSPRGPYLNLVLHKAEEDLNGYLARKGHLPEPTARFYAAELLLALEHVHKKGFVWRDLKLENVLIKADGHIAICDFDLALPNPAIHSSAEAEQERQREEHSSSKGPHIFGTMDYLSPEVIQGGGHTEMSDFWAYGVLVYEIVYGARPFAAWSQERTFYNITTRTLETPNKPEVSQVARSFITQLLRKAGYPKVDPKKRLGGEGGAEAIKLHPFFEGIDFDTLHEQDALKYYKLPSAREAEGEKAFRNGSA